MFYFFAILYNHYLQLFPLYVTAVIAEVTQPSLGVGYEIGRALAMGKKILCLYRSDPTNAKSKTFFFFLLFLY